MMTLDVGNKDQIAEKEFGSCCGMPTCQARFMQGLRLKRAVDAGNGKTYISSLWPFRLGDSTI